LGIDTLTLANLRRVSTRSFSHRGFFVVDLALWRGRLCDTIDSGHGDFLAAIV
jgi:hypothetical protein